MPSTALATATSLPASTRPIAHHMPRRGFLAGLAALPLIGGSLALIGHPIAAAEAVTPDLLHNYNQWLWGEHFRCAQELESRFAVPDPRFRHVLNAGAAYHSQPDWNWNAHLSPPSTRAAAVLAAVGCNWREG